MALSPMMKQYLEIKEQNPDCLLLFRLGDFYEMFFDDAQLVSKELDLVLTSRDCGLPERAPMCGVPFHAADNYIAKLVANGHKVAICEQMNLPQKGIATREVVRIVTPGTVMESEMLSADSNNYLLSVYLEGEKAGVCWADISTGEFNRTTVDAQINLRLNDLLLRINPAEIICNPSMKARSLNLSAVKYGGLCGFRSLDEGEFDLNKAREIIPTMCKDSANILAEDPVCVKACGALLRYIKQTQKRELNYIHPGKDDGETMLIDSSAAKTLELLAASTGKKQGSVYSAINKTKTGMGARLLGKRLSAPSANEQTINYRLDGVAELYENRIARENISETLAGIYDIERISTRIAYGNITPKECVALAMSLENIIPLKNALSGCSSHILSALASSLDTMRDIAALIRASITDDPPTFVRDGGVIRDKYNNELDEYRAVSKDSKSLLAAMEAQQKERTKIKNLRIGYNSVFGYYIEVSKGNVDKVPFRYVRKQTLTTGERYITEELKEIEDKILGAVEKSVKLELALFEQIKLQMLKVIPMLQSTARAVAVTDTLLSFAKLSAAGNYCKPVINDTIEGISIKGGRHPVVEALMKSDEFVPNDTELDCYQNRTMIITGPNMAGKSTYMRQVALIVFMAHVGCFVPAKSAQISITDRIFTRIGASDDLAYGQSTFMVEMVEVATILQNATMRSLLILDEIGRGTSTFDGLSIAKAVLEDVTARIRCKTLFSTHFHELTELEGNLEGAVNYKIVAAERDKGIIFLHKIMRGGTNKSFGIEVAKLAGLPQKVIARARAVSKELENDAHKSRVAKTESRVPDMVDMMEQNEIIGQLKELDVNNMSPIQALNVLGELVKKALK